ncbi:PREDICTED: uncharacterized protein LOC109471633 [Branchiostoma belcheri]|uniref:Uncharacterized protein LOC109471633 n=1 Tax=Branchiostoma belcheri TaxID=7741 RepID=A0A6P4YBP0_BRABE|nr:PREDICTED: uncharacterized protein LOC109471633 [Branchiostoma belcheri]
MKPFTVVAALGAWFILVAMTTVEARDTVNIPCWEKQACSTCPGWQEAAMAEGICCPCCLALCSKLVTEDFAICEVPTEMMNCTVEVVTSSGLETTVTMVTKMANTDMRSGGQTRGAPLAKAAVVGMMVLTRVMICDIL